MKPSKYKLRAECVVDIGRMVEAIAPCSMKMKRHKQFPDTYAEFTSILDLAEIKKRLAGIPDGHVMLETVDLASQFTGERKV